MTFSVIYKMLQERFSLLDLCRVILFVKPETLLFVLLRERIRNDRVDKFMTDFHVLLYLILPELNEAPGRTIVCAIGCGDLRLRECMDESVSRMIQECGILGQWGGRWIDDARREGTDIFSKKELGGGIQRETRRHVLEVHGIPFT